MSLPSKITLSEFTTTLKRYDATITAASRPKPETLSSLDKWRRTVLPSAIAARSPPHMTKPELYRLVDCKLKRGKMRPILRLIESNDADFVVSTTTTAFSSPDVQSSFTHLLSIKGVGPATASYVLAAHKPSEAPMFSDEAFRWVVHDGAWDTKIKYDAKEYWDYYDKVGAAAKRLGLENREDVERVGFVLGQEAAAASAKGGAAPKGRKPVESKKRKSTAVAEAESEKTERGKEKKKSRLQEKRAIDSATTAGTTRSGRVLRSRKTAAE